METKLHTGNESEIMSLEELSVGRLNRAKTIATFIVIISGLTILASAAMIMTEYRRDPIVKKALADTKLRYPYYQTSPLPGNQIEHFRKVAERGMEVTCYWVTKGAVTVMSACKFEEVQ